MLNYSYLLTKEHLFQQVLGIKYSQFRKLLPKFSRVLREKEYQRIPSDKRIRIPGGGRKSKLGEDEGKLFFILFYYRHYPTLRLAELLFELSNSNICHWIHFLSQALWEVLGYQLKLPEVKARLGKFNQLITVCPQLKEFISDGTERPFKRPKDKDDQKKYYSGKKKRHTIKNQVTIHPRSKRILDISDTVEGKMHDKTLMEKSGILLKAPPGSKGMGDSGYEGLRKDYPWIKFITPIKKNPGKERTEGEKQINKVISSIRVKVEHVIGKLKINKILTDKFRGNLKFADLAFKNCACLYNFKLNSS